ncbi:MAG: RNA polymerase sigma factor [Bacteroidota bacterium]|jgi:RNA polymerase sigma factor (sigma-70 family)
MTAREYNTAVDQYSDNIYRFALKHLKNEMTAKDIVQETFTKVWIKHEEVAFEKVKSYLFTTAYHALVDWIKKDGRNGDIEKTNGPSEEFSISFDLQEVLHDALDRLPEIQRTVVLLRDYEGYNYNEIAEITGLNESQVKVYIFRARQALKDYIKRVDLVV